MQHNGFNTLANFPHAFGGDRVYAFDINQELSDIDGFSGEAIDLFTDFQKGQISPSVADGGANPKIIRLVFNGPTETSLIGFGSDDTTLSNGKLILKGVDGQILGEVDQSLDDTKRGVLFFPFEQTTFIEAILELYTDDQVSINGAWIPKSSRVAVAAIDGLIPPGAQTETILEADEEWTSEIIDTKNYVWVIASATSDIESAENGYRIEFCVDKTFADYKTWDAPYTVGAGKKKTYSEQPVVRYLRIKYKNGSTGSATVVISTQLKPVPSKASSHKINDSIDGEDDAELTKSILTAFSLLTGGSENIRSFRGALTVDPALVHKVGINEYFHRLTGVSTTTSITANILATAINVVSSAGMNIGDKIQVPTARPNGELFFTITDIVVNVLTLDQPIPIEIPSGSAVDVISTNMAVDGTLASPVVFTIAPPAGAIWQLTRTIPTMADNLAMDDGKFGGIAALMNGALIRAHSDGVYDNITIWKTNGELASDMFDVTYTDKGPAGENGLRGRWTVTKSEFVVELNGDTSDRIDILIQDPLSGLTTYEQKAQGRLFGG